MGEKEDPARRRMLWHEPRATNLVEIIAVPAERYPELTAFRVAQHGCEDEDLTWGQLWRGAGAQATRLRDSGFRQGERAIILAPTSPAFFYSFFGVLLAGGIPTPLAPPTSLNGNKLQLYKDYLQAIIADADVAVCLALPKVCEALGPEVAGFSPGTHVMTAGEVTDGDQGFESVPLEGSTTALIQYTSGSTSLPRGVELTHDNVIANLSAIASTFMRPDDIGVSWLPLYHDMGLIGTFLAPLYARMPVVLMPPQAFIKDPVLWLQTISDVHATGAVAPNFALGYTVSRVRPEEIPDVRLDSLRLILNGAEPIDADAVQKFEEHLRPLGLQPKTVRPVYGLAESTLAVTFSDERVFDVDIIDAEELEVERRAIPGGERTRSVVSVGRPIVTQEVRIFGEDGEVLPDRRVGEILVRGPSIMKGYFRRTSETEHVLRGGWLHTGDLGYMADGCLYVTGRIKDVIIRHGRNYYPQDLELQVAGIEGIYQGGVVAFAVDSDSGTTVVVVAESRVRGAEAQSRLIGEIRLKCHDAVLFGPDNVCFVPPGALPRTTSGKLRRHEAKRLYLQNGFSQAAVA